MEDEANPVFSIGYPGGQDGHILSAWDCPHYSRKSKTNPLLTKLARSKWLDIGLVHFLRLYGATRSSLVSERAGYKSNEKCRRNITPYLK